MGRSREAAHPATAPMAALTATTETNATPICSGETGLVTYATAIEKATMPVPSLKRLSASTSVASRRGESSPLKVAMTATGSVAASIAPTMNACAGGNPAPRFKTSATSAALTRTPGPASSETPSSDGRNFSKSV